MRFLGMVLMLLLLPDAAFAAKVEKLPIQNGGWTGGDAAYNRMLPDGRRLWVFGDSLIGKVEAGQRKNFAMFRNAVGIESPEGEVSYYWGDEEQGVFRNAKEKEWYWPVDFLIMENKMAFFFLRRMEVTDPDNILGFRVVGMDIAVVEDVTLPAAKWNIDYVPLLSGQFSLGVAIAEKNGYVYLLGNRDDDHAFHLARIATKSLRDGVLAWTYYDARRDVWQGSEPVRPVIAHGAPEASLTWDESKQEWRLIHSRTGLSADIVMRTAKQLTGEWSAPKLLYTCPEMRAEQPNYICYAGKEVHGGDALRITYSVNSFEFEDLAKDADIYVPRIITP